jgi:hypothetical protein
MGNGFHKWRWRAMTVWVILFTAVVGWQIQINHDTAAKGDAAHAALCVFVQDLSDRTSNSERFLMEHPNGIPGIPGAVIRNSLKNQQKTLASLNSEIEC